MSESLSTLAVLGVVLAADLHPQSKLPTVEPPQTQYPSLSALGYGAFGVGMATPLLAFAVVSEPWRDHVIGFLTGNQRIINLVTGVVVVPEVIQQLRLTYDLGTLQDLVPFSEFEAEPPSSRSKRSERVGRRGSRHSTTQSTRQ
jgi:hypothetical protein